MIWDLGRENFREGSMTPILTANMSDGQGSSVMQPPTLLCPLALLCLHFTSPDNDPYPTANMSNGQGSSGLGSLITVIHCRRFLLRF